MALAAPRMTIFITNILGGLLGYTPPHACHPWLCKYAPSSRTGVDSTQTEERAKADDAHRIARVPCDEFLIFVFLAEALKKTRSVRL